MGIIKKGYTTAAPDPTDFWIEHIEEANGFMLAEVTYPGCTTFEGRKLILFRGRTEAWLRQQMELDPHFSGTKDLGIVARFAPTAYGLWMAQLLMQSIMKGR